MAKFIVIDGLDGCGKATQVKILKERLEKEGYKVYTADFPNYTSKSSTAVQMYLNGELGEDASKLSPYICGSFYTVDRSIQYLTRLHKYFEEDNNTIVICDRYLSANIIHQGSKIDNETEREEYIKFCYDYECKKCGLPKEDITIILTLDTSVSQQLMSKRYNNNEDMKDIHESNLEYLNKCHDRLKDTIEFINENNIANWEEIECTLYENNKAIGIKEIEEISLEVYEKVKRELERA